jgi:hypothetical protein
LCFGDSTADAGYSVRVADQGVVSVVEGMDPAALGDEEDNTQRGGERRRVLPTTPAAVVSMREAVSLGGHSQNDSRQWDLPASVESESVDAGMNMVDNGDEADSVCPGKFPIHPECAEESEGEVAAEPNSVAIVQPVVRNPGKRPRRADDGPADSEQSTGKVNPEAPGWTKRLVLPSSTVDEFYNSDCIPYKAWL